MSAHPKTDSCRAAPGTCPLSNSRNSPPESGGAARSAGVVPSGYFFFGCFGFFFSRLPLSLLMIRVYD